MKTNCISAKERLIYSPKLICVIEEIIHFLIKIICMVPNNLFYIIEMRNMMMVVFIYKIFSDLNILKSSFCLQLLI